MTPNTVAPTTQPMNKAELAKYEYPILSQTKSH